ncbi:MAG: hypothetical protein QXJ72_03415 [Thermoproteota archaeon]
MGEANLPLCLIKFRGVGGKIREKVASSTFQNNAETFEQIGLIRLNIIPIDDRGHVVEDGPSLQEGFTVYVHNYTGFVRKPADEKVCMGRSTITIKTWRVMDFLTNDWMEQEYVVVVVTKNYFGSRLIRVKPDKPVMDIEVRVHLRRKDEIINQDLEWEYSLLNLNNIGLMTKDNAVEEEVTRVRRYLFMLESERQYGLISEKAYYRLKKRLESILFEILFGEEKSVEKICKEAIIRNSA